MTSSTNGRNGGGFETDVVTREIVRGKLLAVADEMGVVLARSSMSPVIYEVLDFACGFCDADGELVSQTNGITVFTGTFSIQINIIKEKFAGRIRPGDIYMLNDPLPRRHPLQRRGRRQAGVRGRRALRLRHLDLPLDRHRRQGAGIAAGRCHRDFSGGHLLPRHPRLQGRASARTPSSR